MTTAVWSTCLVFFQAMLLLGYAYAHLSTKLLPRGAQVIFRLGAVSLLLSAGALSVGPAQAHDYWSNGMAVPTWVKATCCGPEDVHHLTPDQVHRISDQYYMVDGYNKPVPVSSALPSQDGNYWIFYRDNVGGTQSGVYCFFVPMDF